MHPEFHQTDPLPIHFLPPVETFLLFDQPSPENSNDLMNQYYLQFTDTRVQSDCSQASDRLEMLCPFPSSLIPHWLEPFRLTYLGTIRAFEALNYNFYFNAWHVTHLLTKIKKVHTGHFWYLPPSPKGKTNAAKMPRPSIQNTNTTLGHWALGFPSVRLILM